MELFLNYFRILMPTIHTIVKCCETSRVICHVPFFRCHVVVAVARYYDDSSFNGITLEIQYDQSAMRKIVKVGAKLTRHGYK